MLTLPYSTVEVTDFLQQRAPALLAHLAPTQLPIWGHLTPQQLLAHLASSMRYATRAIPQSELEPAAAYAPARQWLLSALPLPRHVALAARPAPAPVVLSLAPAVANFQQALDYFFAYYADQPAALARHPVVGPLTFQQWQVFHFKHLNHHLLQFGLLPHSLLPERRPELLWPGLLTA